MSEEHTISFRLRTKFDEFRSNGHFIDCEIISGDVVEKCHRIILAYYSSVFREIFKDKINPKEITKFTVSDNFKDSINEIINFLYKDTIVITPNNVIAVLAFSAEYKIPILEKMAKDRLESMISVETVLDLSRQMVRFNVVENSVLLVPLLAREYPTYNRSEFFKSVSAWELGKILTHENFPSNYDDDYKLNLIDEYHLEFPVTDLLHREQLAAVVDFKSPKAYRYLLHHKCRWAPDALTLPLYKKALAKRRKNAHVFRQSVESTTGEVSRWTPLQGALKVLYAESAKKDYDLVKFARTLGGLVPSINVIDYGLIKAETSAVEEELPFGPQNALDGRENDHFLTYADVRKLFFAISFGSGAAVRARSMRVSFYGREEAALKLSKMPEEMQGTNVAMRLGLPTEVAIEVDNRAVSKRDLAGIEDTDYAAEFPLDAGAPASSFSVAMLKENAAGAMVLRVCDMRINGRFD